VAQPSGGGVPVHPSAPLVEQQRAASPLTRGTVDRSADGRWQRYKDDLAALAPDSEHSMAVLFAEVVDVRADGLEDPQPQKTKQAHQCEVERVGRHPGGGEHSLELKARQPEGGGFRRDGRAADVVGWRVFQDAVDEAGPIEAGNHGQPPGDGGGLEPADVLHPPQVQLEVVALCAQRRELARLTPREEHPQVRLSVLMRDAPIAREVSDSRQSELTRALLRGVDGRHVDTVRLRQRSPPAANGVTPAADVRVLSGVSGRFHCPRQSL
jgi:hypothetical protein